MGRSVVEARNPRKTRRLLKVVETAAKLSFMPTVRYWHPWLRNDRTEMRWLPVNEDIEVVPGSPLPLDLLQTLVGEAEHRVLVDHCTCREAFGCTHYPVDVGCLMMGDSALEISPEVSRKVGPAEAMQAVRRAVDAGLVPVVGRARLDHVFFGLKDRASLMTVCFCCECCCLTRYMKHVPVSIHESLFPRLEGVSVEVTDDCTGCGKCVNRCYLGAITLDDGTAVIGESCRACGRCASACPSGAVKITLEEADFLDRARESIRSYVRY